MSNGTVTIKEIAKKAEVSIGTVYRALHNRGRINFETQNKIVKIARELGYKRNVLASALSSSTTKKILAVVPEKPASFFELILDGMMDAQKEVKKFKIDIQYIKPQRVNEIEKDSLTSAIDAYKPDGVALLPSPDMKELIDETSRHGIPVITYNCDVAESCRLCYIGQNTYRAGEVAGELMGRFLNGRGDVLVFTGDRNVQAMESRKNGFSDMIRRHYPGIKILETLDYHENEEMAQQKLLDYFQATTESPDGVFATSLTGTLGVAQAVSQLSHSQKPCVIGYDTTKTVEQHLVKGNLTAVLNQDPYLQGYYAVMLMAKYLLESFIPRQEFYYTKSRVILRSNIEEETLQRDLQIPYLK